MVTHPERVRWIFFDFAGTLAFNDPARPWNYVRVCAQRGYFFDRREVRQHVDAVWGTMDTPEGIEHPEASADPHAYDELRASLERAILDRLGIPDTPEREAMVREIMAAQDAPQGYSAYPEAEAALAALRQRGYRMCIVSNFNWSLPEIAHGIGLGRYVDGVVTSARVGYRKPHRRIYHAALEATGAAAGESLFVGDSAGPDYEGPQAVGLQALLIDRRATGQHRGRAQTIHRLTQLPDLLADPRAALAQG